MKRVWDTDELVNIWGLTYDELQLLKTKPPRNHLGFSVQLKYFQYTGRFVKHINDIPEPPLSFLADQVDALFRHGIGDERLVGEVLRFEPLPAAQRMVDRQHGEDLEAKQRLKDHPAAHLGIGADHHVGTPVLEQRQRVRMKAGHEVHLDLRPALAEGIHDRHEPVETRVAFERDAQRASRTALDAFEVALGSLDVGHHLLRQLQKALAGLAQLHGLALAAHHGQPVVGLQCAQLMRQRGLRQVQPLGRTRDRAAVSQCDQGPEMTDFKHVRAISKI